MSKFLISLFILTSFSVLAQNECVVKDGELTIYKRPQEAVGNGRSIDYSVHSDANGLCKRLGHASAVEKSLQNKCDQICALEISNSGEVKQNRCAGQHFECYVSSIICKN